MEKIVDEAIIEWSTNSSFDMNVNVRVSDCDYGVVLSLSPFHLFLCIFLSFPFLYSLSVFLQQFPYPPYRRDLFLLIVDFILPLFVILSFIYSAGVFVKVQYITAYVGGPLGILCGRTLRTVS